MVTISSNIISSSNADEGNREVRRNSRRLFWDAFSRRSSRRNSDSPTILLSTDDTDDLGSHDRWLLDLSGDFFDDGVGSDRGYLGSRIHRLNEQRRHSRSEVIHGTLYYILSMASFFWNCLSLWSVWCSILKLFISIIFS